MRKLIKKIYVYRALLKGEKGLLCKPYSSDLISEAYSRTLRTSSLNKDPSIRCCSEDPRIALEYSKRISDGYSGKIARIILLIFDDGSVSIDGMKGEAYRLWQMEDWINLAALSGGKLTAQNLNYSRSAVKLENLISYGGQATVRAYGNCNKMWMLHTESDADNRYEYILSEEELNDIKTLRRFRYPSYKTIHYNNAIIIDICNSLIQSFEEYSKENSKAWVKCTLKELERIREDVQERIA